MNKKKLKQIKEIVVNLDCDGTLTESICWTPKECLKAKFIERLRPVIEELYNTHFLVIYTARRDHLIPATLEWLRRNNIPYHAISNKKIPGNYIDDKAVNPSDIF